MSAKGFVFMIGFCEIFCYSDLEAMSEIFELLKNSFNLLLAETYAGFFLHKE